MNSDFGANANCPRCQMSLDPQRLHDPIVVCNHCGFVSEDNLKKSEAKLTGSYRKVAVMVAALLLSVFIHSNEWGPHFFSILPLKIKNYIGVSSANDLRSTIMICHERKKPYCVESALEDLLEIEKSNFESALHLGDVRRKLKDTKGAERAYRLHFQRGGQSHTAAFELGKILERNGQLNEAESFYTRALISNPNHAPTELIQRIVHLYIKEGKYKEARAVIKNARKQKGPAAHLFMASELKKIEKKI